MPPKQLPTVWHADPHTIAKISILKTYLFTWFQILGRTRRGEDILYVDGFAGPGEYTNHPMGSPIAAMVAAKEALSRAGNQWMAGDVHCVFIEVDAQRRQNLEQRLIAFGASPHLHYRVMGGSFADGIISLRTLFPLSFAGATPLFVFIDPFGAKGVPFPTVSDILSSSCSEVLINFDADGVARLLLARSVGNNEALITEIFGDEHWKSLDTPNKPFAVLCRELLALYKAKLTGLPNVRYAFSFEMRSRNDSINYFLVFAGQHYLGLEKMKEAMRTMDQTGDYRFADTRIDQPALLRFDSPATYSDEMHRAFRGRRAGYEALRDFVLNNTPFINPKGILKVLEQDGLITVKSTDPKRRKGTFNEAKIVYLEFLP